MNESLKFVTTERLNNCRSALHAALESGIGDTDELRRAIADAERDLAAIDAEDAAEREAAEAESEARIAEQATREVEAAANVLREELVNLATVAVPSIELPTGIAENVQRAGAAVQLARDAESAASGRHTSLLQRQQDLQTKRQVIINRRAAGNVNDDTDKADLALVDADIEGLKPLIEGALADLQHAQAVSSTAQQQFDTAQNQWSVVIGDERHRATMCLAEALEASLVRSAQMLGAGYLVGQHPATRLWRPGADLRHVLAHGR